MYGKHENIHVWCVALENSKFLYARLWRCWLIKYSIPIFASTISTVGAQSIARAQSIAHSHFGNHIFEKNEIFKKLIKIFFRNFACDFFRRRQIFADFKTEFWTGSCTSTYVPISRWGYRGHILRKIIRKPRIRYERWSTSAQSISRAQSIAHIGFAAKKANLQ